MTTKTTITLYIGTQPEPEDRLKIEVSPEEYAQIPPRGSQSNEAVQVIDQTTGNTYYVRRASCGLPNCRCALELATDEVRELPPDPEETNEQSATEAERVLFAFEETDGEAPYGGINSEQLTALHEQNLADLLCNFGHWCDRNGVNMQEVIRRAKGHYDAETGNQGVQFTES